MDPRTYKDKINERLHAWFAKNDPPSYGASAQQAVSAQPPAYEPGQSQQPARPLSPKRPGGSGP